MIYAAFLLGFFAHTALVMCARPRPVTYVPSMWQIRQWRKDRR